MESFFIDGNKFNFEIDKTKRIIKNLRINSLPRKYEVSLIDESVEESINEIVAVSQNPILLIDSNIYKIYGSKIIKKNLLIYKFVAAESKKNITECINFTNFLEKNNITKSSTVIVVGGGIVQDVGAFSCSIYKRGIKWVYFPTTLLSMTDSCIGGKTALNYKNVKNLHALFSSPHKVILNTEFLSTLPRKDILSGLGESLKLSIIGGKESLKSFSSNIDKAIKMDRVALTRIILTSLLIKKSVVEKDEFENNERRSLNYGHSLGNAIEPMSGFYIPHGTAITIGLLIENKISVKAFGLSKDSAKLILDLAKKLIMPRFIKKLSNINLSEVNNYLINDKKAEGKILKIAVPTKIGHINFCKLNLNQTAIRIIKKSVESLLKEL